MTGIEEEDRKKKSVVEDDRYRRRGQAKEKCCRGCKQQKTRIG